MFITVNSSYAVTYPSWEILGSVRFFNCCVWLWPNSITEKHKPRLLEQTKPAIHPHEQRTVFVQTAFGSACPLSLFHGFSKEIVNTSWYTFLIKFLLWPSSVKCSVFLRFLKTQNLSKILCLQPIILWDLPWATYYNLLVHITRSVSLLYII